ncbi:uncharacterized protein LOC102803452 [Saccoglossus kowalevskii]
MCLASVMAKQSDDWYILEEEVTLETVDVDISSWHFVCNKDLMESPIDKPSEPKPSNELSEFSTLDEFSSLEEGPLSPPEKKMNVSEHEMNIAIPVSTDAVGVLEEDTPRFSEPDTEDDSFVIPQVQFSDSRDSEHPVMRSLMIDSGQGSLVAGLSQEEFPDMSSEDDHFLSSSDVSIPMGTGTSDEQTTTDTESGDRTMQTVVDIKSQPAVSEAIAEISSDFVSGTFNVSLAQHPIDDASTPRSLEEESSPDCSPRMQQQMHDGHVISISGRKVSEESALSEHLLEDDVPSPQPLEVVEELSQYPIEKTANDQSEANAFAKTDNVRSEEMFPLQQEQTITVDEDMVMKSEDIKDNIVVPDDETINFPQNKSTVSMISESMAMYGKKPMHSSTPFTAHSFDPIAKIQLPPEPKETQPTIVSAEITISAPQPQLEHEDATHCKEELTVPASVSVKKNSMNGCKREGAAVESTPILEVSTESEQNSTASIEVKPSSFYIEYPPELQSGSAGDFEEDSTRKKSVQIKDNVDDHVWSGIQDQGIRARIEQATHSLGEGDREKHPAKYSYSSYVSQDSLARRVALLLGEDVGAEIEGELRRQSDSFKEPEIEATTDDYSSLMETGEEVGGVILSAQSREPIKHSLSMDSYHEFIPPPEEFDEPIRRTYSPPASGSDSGESADSISRKVAQILSHEDLVDDFRFRRPYSPAGSDSTGTTDSMAQNVDYLTHNVDSLLNIMHLQSRNDAEGFDLPDQTPSPSTLSEASTSSSVKAIIERIMSKQARPEGDIFNGSGFIDVSHMYQLPDRSSPAGSADFDDDFATQINGTETIMSRPQETVDGEVETINQNASLNNDAEEPKLESDRDEDSPDSLTEGPTLSKQISTPVKMRTKLAKSVSSPASSARFSLHDDDDDDEEEAVAQAARPSDDHFGDQLSRRVSSNISGTSLQSADSLHKRVQVLLANTAYVEHHPQTSSHYGIPDPETTPRDSNIPDGGYEGLEIYYGKLPDSPTRSYRGTERARSLERTGRHSDEATLFRQGSPHSSPPSRTTLERPATIDLPMDFARGDRQRSLNDYPSSIRDEERSSLTAPVGRSDVNYEPVTRTDPEGRSSRGDPVLRRRIAARLLDDSTETPPLMTSTMRSPPRNEAANRLLTNTTVFSTVSTESSPSYVSSFADFHISTSGLNTETRDRLIDMPISGRTSNTGAELVYGVLPPTRTSTSFHGITSEGASSAPTLDTTTQGHDESFTLADRVRKILEKESPVHHASQILDEVEATSSSVPTQQGVSQMEKQPKTVTTLQSGVSTTTSLPYSPILATGYKPFGASDFAKNLISTQLQKMSENRFDQSIELRQQVTGIIDRHMVDPSEVTSGTPQFRRESRERTYYEERADDSTATDDVVRRAIHDAWTVRDSPPVTPRQVDFGLSRQPVPSREEREVPLGVEERDTLYGLLPASAMSSTRTSPTTSTVRTSSQDSHPPTSFTTTTSREYTVMHSNGTGPLDTGGAFTFRKSLGEPNTDSIGTNDLPMTLSLAKPLDSENTRSPTPTKPYSGSSTERSVDSASVTPRTSGMSYRPYRPHGSADAFHMYLPEHEDTALSPGRSETTMESTHSGSDDAFGPYVPPDSLGSRQDLVTNKHPTGIYGNRSEKKKHVWDAAQDASLLTSKISEKSFETDQSMEIHVVPEDKDSSTDNLRTKPVRSFIDYPDDLRSKTPDEAASKLRSTPGSTGTSPLRQQSGQRTHDFRNGNFSLGTDISGLPARSFIEYPSDLKSLSENSFTVTPDKGKNNGVSLPKESPRSILKMSPVKDNVTPRQAGMESRERYLHEPFSISPKRSTVSQSPSFVSHSERPWVETQALQRSLGSRSNEVRDLIVTGSPGRRFDGRDRSPSQEGVPRSDSPMFKPSCSSPGRKNGKQEKLTSSEGVRSESPVHQPSTTTFEVRESPVKEHNLHSSRPVGGSGTEHANQKHSAGVQQTTPLTSFGRTIPEQPHRRPVIGRDQTLQTREQQFLPPQARHSPFEVDYAKLPDQPVTSLPTRDYATMPSMQNRALVDRSYSHVPDRVSPDVTGVNVDDVGSQINDGYTTWPPRGIARRSTAPSPTVPTVPEARPLPVPEPSPRYSRQVLQEILEQEDRDAQRLNDLWNKFQEMVSVKADDTALTDRMERLASLIQNPVQHTVRYAEPQGFMEIDSDTSTMSSSSTRGRQRRKWQKHHQFVPKLESVEAIEPYPVQPMSRYEEPPTARSEDSFMTNDTLTSERVMNVVRHVEGTAPMPVQQQRKPTTGREARRPEQEVRRAAPMRTTTEPSIDAKRIQEILAAEASHSEDPSSLTDASMASNMSYETERLYKMLGPRGVRHLGVKLARLQRQIDKQRERHERHQAKRVERQRHYDKQRVFESESTLSAESIDTERLVRAFGPERVNIYASTPVPSTGRTAELQESEMSQASITTESTLTEERGRSRPCLTKVKSRDDFDVRYGSSSETISSESSVHFSRNKRARSLHDIVGEKHSDAREVKAYQRRVKETKPVERKKVKRFEYFEIDDEGFKKPIKPAAKKMNANTKTTDSDDTSTRDIGTTFPSPDVRTRKKKGGTAFTVTLGTQTTPKSGDKEKPKRPLKVLDKPKLGKSKIFTPETPDSTEPVKIRPAPLAWFQPVVASKPWEEEKPAEPIPLKENKSEEENKKSLQDAFEERKNQFISKSRERVKHLQLAAEERKIAAHYERERLKLFEENRLKKYSPNVHPLSDNLHQPKRRQMSRKEMKKQTEKLYSKLPEVVRKKEEQKKQQSYKTNRLRAQIYKQKVLKELNNKPWTGMPVL